MNAVKTIKVLTLISVNKTRTKPFSKKFQRAKTDPVFPYSTDSVVAVSLSPAPLLLLKHTLPFSCNIKGFGSEGV